MNAAEMHVSAPAGLHDRVVARLFSYRLDEALAEGASAEDDAALALRARRLIDLSTRRKIAMAIEHAISEAAARRRSRRRSSIQLLPDRIDGVESELEMLAGLLAEPGPVDARGVAEARLLLTDGTGPLYYRQSKLSVHDWVENAIAHLAPEE